MAVALEWSGNPTVTAAAAIDSDTFDIPPIGTIGFSLVVTVSGTGGPGITGNLQIVVSNTDIDSEYAPIGPMVAVNLASGMSANFPFSVQGAYLFAKLRWVQTGPDNSGTLGYGAWSATVQFAPAVAGSFLLLNGVAWPISTDSASPDLKEIGYKQRAVDGSMTRTARAAKQSWKLKTIPLSPSDALAFKNMLVGYINGHHWGFDVATTYLYSDKGILGVVTGVATYTTAGPTPKFGAGCVKISSAGSIAFKGATNTRVGGGTGTFYSAIVWFWNGASWDGYAWSYDGTNYTVFKNGGLIAAVIPGFASTAVDGSGTFNLFGQNYAGMNQISYFDDLVVLPYVARPQDLALWSNAAVPFSALPQLTPGGTVLELPIPAAVQGEVTDIKEMYANTGDGNGTYPNAQQITFELDEV